MLRSAVSYLYIIIHDMPAHTMPNDQNDEPMPP